MDSRVVGTIPKEISFIEAAPLFCAGATVYGALKAVGIVPDQVVAIVGIGGLGHLGVQYARALGMRVVAIDNRQEALDLLNTLPKHLQPEQSHLLHSSGGQGKNQNGSLFKTLGEGFYDSNPGIDKIVICAEDKTLPRMCQQFLRKGGVIYDIGLPTDSPLEVDAFALSFKEQAIKGRLICTPSEAQELVNLHARSKCKTHIAKTYPIDDIKQVYDHYKQKESVGRVVVAFD